MNLPKRVLLNARRALKYREEEVEVEVPYAGGGVGEHAYAGVGDGAFQYARRLEEQ